MGAVIALFLISLLITVALTPIVMRLARRVGAVDRGGYRKVSRGDIPLLGGLAIAAPLLIACFSAGVAGHVIIRNWKWFWAHHRESFDFLLSLASFRNECLTFAVGGCAIVALGIVDDMVGLRARWKLFGQCVVAAFVCFSGFILTSVTVPFWGTLDLGIALGAFLTILWIAGLINACNLIDGIDGLASGITAVGTVALVALGFIQGNEYLVVIGAALAGSLTAFLFYNFPPARVFLGDTGSMFIGYTLATMALIGAQKSETVVIIVAPMLALSFPIFETLISMIRRYVAGVPVFGGDDLHTHHRLLRKGYSQPGVVLTLCGTASLFAVAAIMSSVIPENSKWAWLPYAVYFGSLVNIAWLAGYLRPTNFRSIIERRYRNRAFQSFKKYAAQRVYANTPPVSLSLLLELCRHELGLCYIEIGLNGREDSLSSPTGFKRNQESPLTGDIRVKSRDKQDILISYEFNSLPDQSMRHDVSLCLAGIFDGMRIEHLSEPKGPDSVVEEVEDHTKIVHFAAGRKRRTND